MRERLLLLSGDGLRINGWLDWRTIALRYVTIKDLHFRRQEGPWLRFGDEDVLAIVGPNLDRMRVVQRSNVEADLVWPPFESQRQFCSAIRTEVYVDILAASV